MRRLLVLLLTAALLGAGAAAVEARPGEKSPRLHAFHSCTTLLGYAQRNGVRVIRDRTRERPIPPPAPGPMVGPIVEGMGGAGGGDGAAPVAAPMPAAGGQDTSQTNVQEAAVDEPDWVKASGSTLFVARDGELRAIDASGDRPRALGSVDVSGSAQELLLHGDRALVVATTGSSLPMPMAAQVPGVAPARWTGRT